MAEIVHLVSLRDQRSRACAARHLRSLGNNHHAEESSTVVAMLEHVGHVIDIKRALRNQNHVRTPGNAAVNGDPARITAHDLHHDHAVMRFSRGVHAVNGFSSDHYRRIEAEAEVRSAQIVIDGLGHGDHLHAAFKQFLRNRLRVIAAQHHQRLYTIVVQVLDALLQAALFLGRVSA